MYLLIPGRHQLLTNFQFEYLRGVVADKSTQIDAVIFAVTSSNHANTRRNPLPFYLRAISIEAFGSALGVPTYIYGIDDVGNLSNFASYTLKRIRHDSDLLFDLKPSNTNVVCSTQVLRMYEQLGFHILTAELKDTRSWEYQSELPWDIVEYIATKSPNWRKDAFVKNKMHASAYDVWCKYNLGEKVQVLFRDNMISSDGDLTETRDYNIYVRQMDEIADVKYKDTAPFIQPGRIGDIGCAVGSWLKLACRDERFRESDFYGIEVSRHLYEICQQRKLNGEFANPFVFFAQKNAVTGLAFEASSMNTIHTSSLTHEIESYGSRADVLQFIRNRYDELVPGGVWINRDVVGPFNKDRQVLMLLNDVDGDNDPSSALDGLSTQARFFRFAQEFRRHEGYILRYEQELIDGRMYISLSLKDASEFMSRKDYTDNWESEMHETFCFWDFDEWKQHLQEVGFSIHRESTVFRNEWIANNRWKGKVSLFEMVDGVLKQLEYPVTTMFLIGVKN